MRVAVDPLYVTSTRLVQEFVRVRSHKASDDEREREAVLLALCTRTFTEGVLVFCGTKIAAHRLRILFGLAKLQAAELHGNLTQLQVTFRSLMVIQCTDSLAPRISGGVSRRSCELSPGYRCCRAWVRRGGRDHCAELPTAPYRGHVRAPRGAHGACRAQGQGCVARGRCAC